MPPDQYRLRLVWVISAMLLAFAGDGIQNIVQASIGSGDIAIQVGVIGSMICSYVCLELFGRSPPPKRKRKKRRPPTPKI